MLIANNSIPSIRSRLDATLVREGDSLNPSLTASRSALNSFITAPRNATITQTGNVATIPYSDSPDSYSGNTIVSIVINSQNYYLSNDPEPPEGFYYINDEANQIEINTGYDADGLSVKYEIMISTAKPNKVKSVPLLFKQYQVVGDFSFSQSFGGHPSGSFSIMARRSQYSSIRNALKPGTPVDLQGIDYRIRNLTRVETLNGQGNILINISLQGYWERQSDTLRNELDEPIRVLDLINNSCGFEYTYQDALKRVGISLKGGNIAVKVGRNISSSQTITARQLLEDSRRLLVSGCYVDWTSRSGIVLRKWDSPRTFMIDPYIADLSQQQFPSVTITENGHGAMVNGCYLSHELNNAELQLDQDPAGTQDGDEYICLTQGNKNPTSPPPELRGGVYYSFDLTKLRSPMLSFDNSENSRLITRCQLNGSDLEVTEEYYGWVFTSVDIFDYRIDSDSNISYIPKTLTDIALNARWELVKVIRKQYIYDETTGYHLSTQGSGWQLIRDLVETDEKEAIQLAATIALETDQDAIAELQRHLLGYTQFYKRTINPSEIFELEDLGNYYSDLRKPDEDDDDFIPSLYPRLSQREENSLITRPDPRSTAGEVQPDLILGSNATEIQEIEINSTSPERFLSWNPVSNQEGTNLDQVTSSESFTENSGRPSLQSRLIKTTGCYHPKKDDNGNQPKYMVSTPGVDSFNLTTQTLSYPGAYTIQQAIAAVTLDYKIKNSQDSCTLETPLGEPIKEIRMGDIIIYKGKKYRSFGYNQNGRIQPGGDYYNNISLNSGRDIELSLIRKVT